MQQATDTDFQPKAGNRLRILCLHGFRQNASGFKGRTCALARRLRDVAELVFIDAPHTLPLYYKPKDTSNQPQGSTLSANVKDGYTTHSNGQEKQEIQPDTQQADVGCGSSYQSVQNTMTGPTSPVTDKLPNPKRAWMLSPALMQKQKEVGHGTVWEIAPDYVDDQQHLQQTEGWEQSMELLLRAVHDLGPFDGLLGFSQGSTAVALLCAHQKQQAQRLQQYQAQDESCSSVSSSAEHPSNPLSTLDAKDRKPMQETQLQLKFAILASGYPPPNAAHQDMLYQLGALDIPSIHIFASGDDQQIDAVESTALMHLFKEGPGRACIQHNAAHVIPSSKEHVQAIKHFLLQFLDTKQTSA